MIKGAVFWRSVLCFNSVLYRLQLHRRWQQQQQQQCIAAASLGAWMVDSSVVLKREPPETRHVPIEDSSFSFLFFITHRASLSMTNASLRAAETTLYWLLSSAISKVMWTR